MPTTKTTFAELQRQNNELKKRVKALELMENTVLNSFPIGIHMYHLDKKGRLIFDGANTSADKILGVENIRYIGKPIEEAFPPLAYTEVPDKYKRAALYGEPWHTEQIVYQDEEIAGAFEVHAFQTEINHMIAVFSDITERKKSERLLQNSKERLQLAYEGAELGLWDCHIPGGKVIFNEQMTRLIGISEEDLILDVEKWKSYIHPEDLPKAMELLKNHMDGKTAYYECEIRVCADGKSWRWILDKGKVLDRDESGKPLRAAGTYLDISQLKEVEAQLRNNESFLKNVFHAIQDGLSVLDKDFNILRTNQWMEELYKAHMPLIGRKCYEVYQRRTSPCPWCPTIITLKTGEKKSQVVPYPEEKNPVGWLDISTFPVMNGQGEVESVIEYVKDISEQKKAEIKLRQSEEHLKTTLNSIGDAVITTDLQGCISRMNPVAQKLTGWSLHNAKGKKLEDIFTIVNAHSRKRAENPVNRVIKTGKIVGLANHTMLISRDGKEYQIADSAAPIKNTDGNTSGVVLVFRDVTQEYLKNERIKESEGFLKAIFESIQDGISVLNPDLTIRYVNPVMEKWYSTNLPLTGKKCFSCYHNIKKPCDPCPSIRCMETGKMETAVVSGWPNTEAQVQWIELFSYPVKDPESGKVTGIVEFMRDITERKKSEEILRDSENKMRSIFRVAPTGIGVVKNRILQEVNPLICEMTGYSKEELIGKSARLLYPTQDDYEYVGKEKYRQIAEKGSGVVETRWIRKDKKIINILLASTPIDVSDLAKGVTFTALDITDRKKAEENVRISEDRLQKIMLAANDGMWDWDLKTNKVYYDPRYYQMAGYNVDEFPHNLEEFRKRVHHDDVQYVMSEAESNIIGKKDRFKVEFRFRKKDNTWMWIMGRGIIVERDEKGNPTRFVGTHTDIEQRKKAEMEVKLKNEEYLAINEELQESIARIQQMNIELERAKEKAEESDRLKSAFLANMSHEIRTPMNGILGFANLLKEHQISLEKKVQYIDIIERSGIRMLNIINDLIDISKIEAGQVEVKVTECNVNDQIEYIYTFFKPEVEKKGMLLSYKYELDGKESIILTDREKLYAILTNLIKNAIKYTNEGSIEFGYHRKEKEIEFYVIDTGIGIPGERHDVIFERFVQADMNITKPYEGAGLGLSITKAYVEMLGGRIWLESERGNGTRFYFTIPYKPLVEKQQITKKEDNNPIKESPLKNLSVMIVEDDETAKVYLHEIFNKSCKVVHFANNGAEAVDLVKNNSQIDVILMDIKMPGMDGYMATQKIREFNEDVVIIAQTAYALSGDRERALEAGCNDYISKPLNKKELIEVITRNIRKLP